MEPLAEAIFILAQPGNIALVIAATLLGIVVGAIPGLTSTIAIGLLIPVTFNFSSANSTFILLLGIYCGAMNGGSIPAILLNLPGTPTAAITAIEGYPLTRKGEGGRALGVAAMSSTLGGIISCIFLIFLSLELADVAVLLFAPEYFALTVFALAVTMALASDSVLKGSIGMSFGLLISTIGMDPISPFPRFTFGVPELLIGIPPIPATIGLFCTAEAFRLAGQPGGVARLQKEIPGLLVAARELPRLWTTIVKSSLFGTFLGILPGVGNVSASLLSYGEAKRKSDHPEEFGKGAIEGVCASEAANNAVTGGSLIPMLTLGIPGETNTLMLLGAMIVHGLVPGPTLFHEETTLVYVIFGTMVVSNLLILPLGVMLSKHVAKIALVHPRYLVPIILVLSITGPSIGYGHIYYFWITLAFGLLGFACLRADFPLLPLAIGLILGPILEEKLRAGLMMSKGSAAIFLTRPISLAFLILSLAAVAYGLWREARIRKPRASLGG